MESYATLHTPSHVVIAFDATKDHCERELRFTINSIRIRGDFLRAGDTLLMLGVLHRVTHPMGYHSKPCPEFFGTSVRAMEEEISNKLDAYVNLLHRSAEDCDYQGVSIEVKITAGVPIKNVVLQEALNSKATWVILDRHLGRDWKSYVKQIPCSVALVQDSLSLQVLRHRRIREPADTLDDHKQVFYSMSKPVVPLSNFHFLDQFLEYNFSEKELSNILLPFLYQQQELKKLRPEEKGGLKGCLGKLVALVRADKKIVPNA